MMDVRLLPTVSKKKVFGTFKRKFIAFSIFTEFAERKNECSRDQLVAIGNRLLDWFSVITFDSKKKPSYHKKYGKGMSNYLSF